MFIYRLGVTLEAETLGSRTHSQHSGRSQRGNGHMEMDTMQLGAPELQHALQLHLLPRLQPRLLANLRATCECLKLLVDTAPGAMWLEPASTIVHVESLPLAGNGQAVQARLRSLARLSARLASGVYIPAEVIKVPHSSTMASHMTWGACSPTHGLCSQLQQGTLSWDLSTSPPVSRDISDQPALVGAAGAPDASRVYFWCSWSGGVGRLAFIQGEPQKGLQGQYSHPCRPGGAVHVGRPIQSQ
ncbi:hypothetical protein WJX84_009527 [Apatococcus fuscideae]|uniref:Uncharacterized protein n=1 Tax=Apatococcus fuscideae TaxID=2026836 RepID=A0AAW1REG0_9CHLO